MRSFLVIVFCVSLAQGKPQYNYPAPAPVPSTPSGSYGAVLGGGAAFASSDTSDFSGLQAGGAGLGVGGGFGTGGGFGAGGGFGSGAGFASGGGVAAGDGGTLVQKHIYVHVAPPEPEEVRSQRPIASGQSTKHYKIIFIKAPSYPSYQQQILQAQAQNEEKTLVYVLVKKPDEAADITLPTAAPTSPSKPEVYFIRYKAKSEVTGGGGAAAGSQLAGSGFGLSGNAAIGGGASLGLSSSSSSNTQFNTASSFNLNTGDSSSSVSVGRPATNYGPPGKSGPY